MLLIKNQINITQSSFISILSNLLGIIPSHILYKSRLAIATTITGRRIPGVRYNKAGYAI